MIDKAKMNEAKTEMTFAYPTPLHWCEANQIDLESIGDMADQELDKFRTIMGRDMSNKGAFAVAFSIGFETAKQQMKNETEVPNLTFFDEPMDEPDEDETA